MGFCNIEVFPSPKSQSHALGPFDDKSVNLIVVLQLIVSLKLKAVTGGAAGNTHVQFASNPLPFTAWSACK